MWERGKALAVVALVAALSACGGGVTNDSHVPRQSAPAGGGSAASADPADLIGSWFLDAPGEPDGAMLSIGDPVEQGILLFRPCGVLDLLWRANRDGMLLMRTGGGDGSCYHPAGDHPRPDPGWVTHVVSFRADGPAELLLDQDGHTVARLTPGAHPTVGPNRIGTYASPPTATPKLRASWRLPSALPGGVTAASADDVLGRWLPVNHQPAQAFVEFRRDGDYQGSDGCNGISGGYVVGGGGIVLATTGAQTLIGCVTAPLAGWVGESGRLGLRHHRLVFVAPDGHVLGEAVRA